MLPEDDGIAIVRAEFVDEAADWFDLRVANDRTLLAVPRSDETVDTLQTAETSPKSITMPVSRLMILMAALTGR